MKLSDVIEEFINMSLLSNEGEIEIKRNELAGEFSCVPSQINYVISTRFTPQRGYIVESKRGGGGYVIIKRIDIDKNDYTMHLMNSIGDEIDYSTTKVFIKQLIDFRIITEREGQMILGATSDNVLNFRAEIRNKLRANILKSILIAVV